MFHAHDAVQSHLFHHGSAVNELGWRRRKGKRFGAASSDIIGRESGGVLRFVAPPGRLSLGGGHLGPLTSGRAVFVAPKHRTLPELAPEDSVSASAHMSSYDAASIPMGTATTVGSGIGDVSQQRFHDVGHVEMTNELVFRQNRQRGSEGYGAECSRFRRTSDKDERRYLHMPRHASCLSVWHSAFASASTWHLHQLRVRRV